jgi:hypothetical protein
MCQSGRLLVRHFSAWLELLEFGVGSRKSKAVKDMGVFVSSAVLQHGLLGDAYPVASVDS